MDALCRVALRELETFTPYQCANLAWSLAMLEQASPRALGAILDRAARDALWAVGVKGTEMDGNSETLLAEAARRAGSKKIGRTGAAGVVWACGRLRVTPRPGEADARCSGACWGRERAARRMSARSSRWRAALVHAVWGVSQMDGVTMSEPHRGGARARAEGRGGEDVRRARRGAQGLRRRRRRGPARHGGSARRRVSENAKSVA